ncbi:hypothetical protein [Desulfonatronum parangueonense]
MSEITGQKEISPGCRRGHENRFVLGWQGNGTGEFRIWFGYNPQVNEDVLQYGEMSGMGEVSPGFLDNVPRSQQTAQASRVTIKKPPQSPLLP